MLNTSPRIEVDSVPTQNVLLIIRQKWDVHNMHLNMHNYVHVDLLRRVNEFSRDSLTLTDQRRGLLEGGATFMPAKSCKFWNISKSVPSFLKYSERTLEKGRFPKVGHRFIHHGVKTSPNRHPIVLLEVITFNFSGYEWSSVTPEDVL